MNGKCNKKLILLILFATTACSSLIPFSVSSRCGQDWENGQFPSFVPESKQARQEFCYLHDLIELSRNQLNFMLEQWALKYNVWDKFYATLKENDEYENVYRRILKINIHHNIWSEELQKILLEIFDLMGDKDTAVETIYNKINEIMDKLSAGKWIHFLKIWALLDEEATEETEIYFEVKKVLPT